MGILVAREHGSSLSACGYLVDVWCLGVKDCNGPKTIDRRKLPEFVKCAGHLGEWDGSSDITFGRDGMPLYIQGPHDDMFAIMTTLRKTAGEGNFHYVAGIG